MAQCVIPAGSMATWPILVGKMGRRGKGGKIKVKEKVKRGRIERRGALGPDFQAGQMGMPGCLTLNSSVPPLGRLLGACLAHRMKVGTSGLTLLPLRP